VSKVICYSCSVEYLFGFSVSRDDKGHSVKDNRSLVKYDDDDVAGFDS